MLHYIKNCCSTLSPPSIHTLDDRFPGHSERTKQVRGSEFEIGEQAQGLLPSLRLQHSLPPKVCYYSACTDAYKEATVGQWETLRWSDRLAKLSTLAKPAVIYPRTRSWNTRLHIDTNTQQQGLKLLHPLLQSVILGLELLVALLELTEPLLLPLPRLASSQRIL